MKINGKKLDSPSVVIVPILRVTGDVFFKVGAVLDFESFNTLCPSPKAPMIQKPGEEAYPDLNDKKYLEKLDEFSKKRTAFMIISSLAYTDKIEWETVNIKDPTTWVNYNNELKAAGLSEIEIGRLVNGVLEANGLDDTKVEEAKKRFLAMAAVKV